MGKLFRRFKAIKIVYITNHSNYKTLRIGGK